METNELLEKDDPVVIVNGKHCYLIGQILLVTNTQYHVDLGDIGTEIYNHSDVQFFTGIKNQEYRKELNDTEIERMFMYIEDNDLTEEIALVKAENDPTIFISNINKAIDYLAILDLLNTAINYNNARISCKSKVDCNKCPKRKKCYFLGANPVK